MLTDYYNPNYGYAWPSYRNMIAKLHCSFSAISRALAELEEAGLLKVFRYTGRRHNQYIPMFCAANPPEPIQSDTGETPAELPQSSSNDTRSTSPRPSDVTSPGNTETKKKPTARKRGVVEPFGEERWTPSGYLVPAVQKWYLNTLIWDGVVRDAAQHKLDAWWHRCPVKMTFRKFMDQVRHLCWNAQHYMPVRNRQDALYRLTRFLEKTCLVGRHFVPRLRLAN